MANDKPRGRRVDIEWTATYQETYQQTFDLADLETHGITLTDSGELSDADCYLDSFLAGKENDETQTQNYCSDREVDSVTVEPG